MKIPNRWAELTLAESWAVGNELILRCAGPAYCGKLRGKEKIKNFSNVFTKHYLDDFLD